MPTYSNRPRVFDDISRQSHSNKSTQLQQVGLFCVSSIARLLVAIRTNEQEQKKRDSRLSSAQSRELRFRRLARCVVQRSWEMLQMGGLASRLVISVPLQPPDRPNSVTGRSHPIGCYGNNVESTPVTLSASNELGGV